MAALISWMREALGSGTWSVEGSAAGASVSVDYYRVKIRDLKVIERPRASP